MIDHENPEAIPDAHFRAVQDWVEQEMAQQPIPGAVVGVLHEGRALVAAFGTTSVEHPLPVSEETLFQVGSITKTFVATAALRLVEAGKIELDTPIRSYLPELKLADESVAARVTLRHLLTHTGGWMGDYFNDFGMGDDALARMVAAMAGLPQLTPLGEVWSYNNAGFYLAGRVLEVVTGTPFEKAIQGLVLNPLGLRQSFFFPHDVITHRFAVGHEVVDGKPQVARPWAVGRAVHPAGGLVCTAADLLRYARFHMGDGTAPDGARLLFPESLAAMQTPQLPSTGISECGLSWSIMTVDGARMIGHGGGTKGQVSYLRIVPSRQFAVVALTNSEEGDPLTYGVANWATKEYLGLELPEALPLDLPEEALRPYAGRYDSAAAALELVLRDGTLVLQVTNKGGFPTPDCPPLSAPPPTRAALYAEDRLVLLDGSFKGDRGEFLRSADGCIAWLRLGGRVHARLG
ncbi:MAG TPA: serine hydrolase domain-containing protein [Anaerolineae bacterium]|nr:serine hydrolase domain-containing protein [Anaerolineae bacterium]